MEWVVPESWVLGFRSDVDKMGIRQVEQGFSLFFAIFEDFSKCNTLKQKIK